MAYIFSFRLVLSSHLAFLTALAHDYDKTMLGNFSMSFATDELRKKVSEDLFNHPDILSDLKEHLKLFHKGGYSQPLMECVYQYDERLRKPNIHDFTMFLMVLSCLKKREYAAFSIPLSCPPFPDKDVAKNEEILLNSLPHPFFGEVDNSKTGPGLCVSDGSIGWKTPIHVAMPVTLDDGKASELRWGLLDKGNVPLEVGSNSAEKFLFYLTYQNGCARWPYGHSHITVFINLKRNHMLGENDEGFAEKLQASGENINDVMMSERNPWLFWIKDIPSDLLDLPPLK
ncbi:hypothetical protein ACXIUK_07780 [Vibrio parahaemolyticus]